MDNIEETKKDRLKYILIYVGVMFLLPSAAGISLTAIFSMPSLVESIYIIFGALSLLFMLFRMRATDSANYKKNKTVFVDKNTPEHKEHTFKQWISFIVGIVDLLCSLAAFYICLNIYQ